MISAPRREILPNCLAINIESLPTGKFLDVSEISNSVILDKKSGHSPPVGGCVDNNEKESLKQFNTRMSPRLAPL